MKPLKWLNTLIMAFSGLTLAFMTIMVLLQVLYRYVLKLPFPESQELAIYAMVYVVMFGSTIAVYNKSHIAVTFLVDKCPASLKLLCKIVAYCALIVFYYLLITEGYALSMRSMMQSSPSTGIPVGYVVASIPISSAISLLYILEQFYGDVKDHFAARQTTAS